MSVPKFRSIAAMVFEKIIYQHTKAVIQYHVFFLCFLLLSISVGRNHLAQNIRKWLVLKFVKFHSLNFESKFGTFVCLS